MRLLLAACVLLFGLAVVRADDDETSLREDGVLYFADNLPNKIVATVKTPTTIYLRRDFQTALAAMGPGSRLELVGMSTEGYIVKGDYRNNSVTGWIQPADLPPGIDPALLAAAKRNQGWHDEVAVAIAHKKVLRGMRPEEVRQSVGRPEQTSSQTDDNGSSYTWVYTTYTDVYQTSYAPGLYNRPVLQTYAVKVPVGQIIVKFTNGQVTSIQEHKTDPDSPGINTD